MGILTTLALLAVQAAAQPAPPADPPRPPDCTAAVHRQFDFWIGEWDVVPTGTTPTPVQKPSSNVIQRAHAGCVLVENWTPATGGTGMSVNIYDRSRGQWHQTWVDSSGGMHDYWGNLEGDAMVLYGTMPVPTSPQVRMRVRLTFSRLGPGRVRQLSERLNAGATWSVNYDLTYARKR